MPPRASPSCARWVFASPSTIWDAGYAGLASFAQLAPDVVKFDMSLVRDIHTNATKRRIVQSMTALFREMNILVVAEGVESAEECEVLSDAGCDLLQGHWFARPARGRFRWPGERARTRMRVT